MVVNMAILRASLMTLVFSAATQLASSAVSCPSGDTSGVIKDAKTCSELVTADNAECYDATFETTCCASCNAVVTSNPNCLYGDSDTCFDFLCSSYTDISSCCATCTSFITTASTVSTSTTSSTSSTSTTVSTSGISTQTDTTVLTSTSVSKKESSNDGPNGGVIAGAVVGSVFGVSFLVIGAFIAVKLLKRKNNKVEDNTSSSSGIPEKLDNYPAPIPEKIDISTILQEKLETSTSEIPEKLENNAGPTTSNDQFAENPTELNTSDKNNVGQSNSNEKANLKHVNELLPYVDETSEITDANSNGIKNSLNVPDVASGDSTGKIKRFSLPPLQETQPDVPLIHGRLPPIGVLANCPAIGTNNINKETKLEDNVEAKENTAELSVKAEKGHNGTVTVDKPTDMHENTNKGVGFKQTDFIFPCFM